MKLDEQIMNKNRVPFSCKLTNKNKVISIDKNVELCYNKHEYLFV